MAHFAVTPNSWSCDVLSLNWLVEIFDRYTKKKAGNRIRLLIVDGHSSHVNMRFIEKCDKFHILLLILLPHSTHRLQPLDVSLFAPLSSFYSTAANTLLTDSLGLINLSKRAFWSLFYPAWQQAFTPMNIASGFARMGIFPYNPSLLIDVITKPKPPTPPPVSIILKTPMTNRTVRHMQRNYKNAPSSPLLTKIFRVNEKLATLRSLDSHMIAGLKRVVILEKKKRQRGKRLNLLGEEDSRPQFFSLGWVQAAKERQEAKKVEEAQRQQDINTRKALAAANKQRKEIEKQQRVEKVAERRLQKVAEI